VLRPGFPPGGSIYTGDDASDTLHLGAFTAGPLVAVATICREPLPETDSERVWRLLGMATLDQYRGLGLGRELAVACINHTRSHGAELILCSARVEVATFYKSLGFAETGEPFALP
jgi:predicted GNAT family N-acyltransferase